MFRIVFRLGSCGAVLFFQICTDIDECSEDPPKCATESNCINSMVRILENASRDNLPVCVCVSTR